jgi:hypothetical protein
MAKESLDFIFNWVVVCGGADAILGGRNVRIVFEVGHPSTGFSLSM